MKISTTNLPDVLVLTPRVFEDDRGLFKETFHAQRYRDEGIELDFVQDNFSRSTKGVLRGMHFQQERPQGKLVQVMRGRIFDVVVDIQPNSETVGQWFGCELTADNHKQLYVPPGYAHGFLALDEINEVLYKCTEFYVPNDQHTLAWNDSTIGIQWPNENPILSQKDEFGLDFGSVLGLSRASAQPEQA